MILAFSDTHLGLRAYSNQEADGLFTSEKDARIALSYILERCRQSDIDLILFLGDMTHTHRPSSETIRWLIDWFREMDSLGKTFVVIPGNHDASIYYHSLIFTKSLHLKNVIVCDQNFLKKQNDYKLIHDGWSISFAPYFYDVHMKNKDQSVFSMLKERLEGSNKKCIIVGHAHESSAKLGSEQVMISKGVDIIDTDSYQKSDIILLLGHIHRHQIYKKGNTTVCYPGSTYYMDSTDLGQTKGFVTIDANGIINFEVIPVVRKFINYNIPESVSIVDFFKNKRIPKNHVMFFTISSYDQIDVDRFKEFIKSTGNFFGKIFFKEEQNIISNFDLNVSISDRKSPILLLREASSIFIKNNPPSFEYDTSDLINEISNVGMEIYNGVDNV